MTIPMHLYSLATIVSGAKILALAALMKRLRKVIKEEKKTAYATASKTFSQTQTVQKTSQEKSWATRTNPVRQTMAEGSALKRKREAMEKAWEYGKY